MDPQTDTPKTYKGKRFIIYRGNTLVVKRTDDEDVANTKVIEMQAAEEISIRIEDRQEGTVTSYTKEMYQRNYRAVTNKLEK